MCYYVATLTCLKFFVKGILGVQTSWYLTLSTEEDKQGHLAMR